MILRTINENITTDVVKSCDVLVAGGGVAGIASALAAARNGAKVLLVEREYILGGLATAGLIAVYLPICDGKGRQVSYGIAEELLKLSVKYGYDEKNAEHWFADYSVEERKNQERYRVQFNPQMFAILCEQLLLEAGVEILYGTLCCATQVNDGKITSVIAENKSGRIAIEAKNVIDCTGDADICKLAGEKTVNFAKGNTLAAWHYSYSDSEGYKLRTRGAADVPEEVANEVDRDEEELCTERFNGIDGDNVSRQIQRSHQFVLRDVIEAQKTDKSYVPVTIATIPQIRMTRRIDGQYTLDTAEEDAVFADSIGIVADWRRRGHTWEVPFSTMLGGRVKNLICAGRNTSVTDNMWDIMRVIPCCAVTGQAAGTAAAMTDDFTLLDIGDLQKNLEKDGVVIHKSEIYKD